MLKPQKLIKLCFVVLCLLIFNSCGVNIFESSANETTDAALYIDVQRALGQKNYSLAITKISEMTAARQAEEEIRYLLASAYAGQCGLEFIPFTDSFGSYDGGTTSLFTFLLETFVDSDATNQSACVNAESTYDLLTGTSAADALNKVYLGFAKIGVVLNKGNRAAGEGNVFNSAGAFDLCDAGDLPDADVAEIITGFSRILTSAAAAGLGGSVPACPGGVDCTKTDTASVNAGDISDFRTLLSAPALPGMTGPGGVCP